MACAVESIRIVKGTLGYLTAPELNAIAKEPADDPRAFCYVWAIYSNTDDRAGFPIAVMYSLNYEVKDFHEGYGYLYQDFQSCTVRFQTELAAVGGASVDIKGARCLRLTAFNKGCSSRTSMQESHEDTFTICSMVWNAWGTKGVDTYMSIFDLNQWYKEQMPSSPQQNCSTYLSYICVSDIVNDVDNNSTVLDVLIDGSSINQFIGIQKPEEHYYPSALEYELCACSDKNIANIYSKGQQRTLLEQFDSTGPLILLKPKEVFEQSIKSGLTPLFADPVHSDLNLQREFLLNIALEQDMIGFLWKCVCTWSNGSFTGMGCSIEFLLNWAWKRATLLKINADKLCETLFDYSEISLDANNRKILNSCTTQISRLHRLYGLMRKKLQLSLSNIDIVQQQENCLHMIVTYLEVLQWLINIGLLPEFAESSTQTIESLLTYYKERRSTVSKETSLLYIDTLIEKEFGNRLQGLWQDDGGDGYYPPPSLQSLLRIYLIENADMVHKHCIVIYLFLDLAMALDQLRFKLIITHLIKFPMVFRISSSMTKIIQALWQLDHGDFPDEKQLQQDDLEIYSTSRHVTRHQKSLLERSKEKHSLAKICEDDVTQTEEMIDDNADKHTTPPPVAEGQARIITRRISQESTSSIASTGNCASDVSPNKKRKTPQKPETDSSRCQALRSGRSKSIDEVSVTSQVTKSSRTTRKSEVSDNDDQSTISLRRSTTKRSKTPDIEGSSKMSSRNKKTKQDTRRG